MAEARHHLRRATAALSVVRVDEWLPTAPQRPLLLVEELLSDLLDWAAEVELVYSLRGLQRSGAVRQAISAVALAKMHPLKVCTFAESLLVRVRMVCAWHEAGVFARGSQQADELLRVIVVVAL
jgi:hypothetical protein